MGEIKLNPIANRCQGPVCSSCGFSFCVECGVPEVICACSHHDEVTGQVRPFEVDPLRDLGQRAGTTIAESSRCQGETASKSLEKAASFQDL